jgi:molecular chaperone HscB
MNNPFEFFGIKPSLAIDLKQLRMKFLEIQRSSHPDFGGDDATNSELANQFYEKLKVPTSRIQILLENHSGKSLNENVLPSDFLMEMMDLNDTIDESKFGDSDATKMAESTLDQIKLELDHQFNDLILEWETDQPDLISKHEQFWKNHIVWYQKYKYWLRLRKNFDGVEEI